MDIWTFGYRREKLDQLVLLLLGIIVGLMVGLVLLYYKRPVSGQNRIDADYAAVEQMFDQLMTELEEKHQTILQELSDWEQKFHSMQGEVETKDRHEQRSPKSTAVLELDRQGLAPLEIAKRLGIGQGEVDLVLQLKKTN